MMRSSSRISQKQGFFLFGDTVNSKKTYYEKLRDPRWQKKRLEIMERDGFACAFCCDSSKTLNVHHYYYLKGVDPWDYCSNSLVCLCEDCHEDFENNKIVLMNDMAYHGEFIPWDFFNMFMNLFDPHTSNDLKISALADILINACFFSIRQQYDKEVIAFCEKVKHLLKEYELNGRKN